jgi:hypothetical protein
VPAFSLVAPGCGDSSRVRRAETNTTRARVASPAVAGDRLPEGKDSNDGDDDAAIDDDRAIAEYGQPASPPEHGELGALVRRYYAYAAAENAAAVCRLLSPAAAQSVAEESETSPPPGPNATCRAPMSALLRSRHRELQRQSRGLAILATRALGKRAIVVLGFSRRAEPRRVRLERSGKRWLLMEPFDAGMP